MSRILGLKEKIILDRYAKRDTEIKAGDKVVRIDPDTREGTVFTYTEDTPLEGVFKPLEWDWDVIAKRVADDVLPSAYEVIRDLDFIPAGRILHGAGTDSQVTYFNCYVMPYPADSRGGIAEHRTKVMEIMSRGGGVGTNGSTLRPAQAKAKSVGGVSSGAISWLEDLSRLTHLVEQGGSRRGAQMIMLADSHPDIIEFITCKIEKQETLDIINEKYGYNLKVNPQNLVKVPGDFLGKHKYMSGANISVALTNDFMEAVKNDDDWELRFPDIDNYSEKEMFSYDANWHKIGDVREWKKLGYGIKTYRTLPARELWDIINICAHSSAEPGVFFIDNANEMTNAKSYGQKVVATNPCGEQPLAPYSVCNLASINLANMVDKERKVVDWDKLYKTVQLGVEFSDNVIDKTYYFLPENEAQAKAERRVGLGVMGLHDLLIWLGVRYGSDESLEVIDEVFEFIANVAYATSVDLAINKGTFPLCNPSEFAEGAYVKRLNKSIQEDIRSFGIRNSHLLTVAPTGSTGTMVGVATGLEPYYAFKFYRSGALGENIEIEADIVREYKAIRGVWDLPEHFVSSMDLTPEEHIKVQNTIQYWVDSSISKTVNAPADTTAQEVASMYMDLYNGGAKGGTVYIDGSRDAQVLSTEKKETEEQPDEVCAICGGETTNSGGCVTCKVCGAQLKCGV